MNENGCYQVGARTFFPKPMPWVVIGMPLLIGFGGYFKITSDGLPFDTTSKLILLAVVLFCGWISWLSERRRMLQRVSVQDDITLILEVSDVKAEISLGLVRELVERRIVEGRSSNWYYTVVDDEGVIPLFRRGTFQQEEEFKQLLSGICHQEWIKIEKPQRAKDLWPDKYRKPKQKSN